MPFLSLFFMYSKKFDLAAKSMLIFCNVSAILDGIYIKK